VVQGVNFDEFAKQMMKGFGAGGNFVVRPRAGRGAFGRQMKPFNP
jgi:hypothetical protein